MITRTFPNYQTVEKTDCIDVRTRSGMLLGWVYEADGLWNAGRFITPTGHTSPYGSDADYSTHESAEAAIEHINNTR